MISLLNKAIIREINPVLAAQLEELEKRGCTRTKVIPSQSGENTLVVEKDGEVCYLHSRYQPSYEAAKIAESYTDVEESSNVVFYGIGLGYLLTAMLANFPNIKYYVVEPDLEVLYRFLEHTELKELDLRLLQGISVDLDRLERDIPDFMAKYQNDCKLVCLKSSMRHYKEEFNDFRKQFLLSLRKEIDNNYFFHTLQSRTITNEMKNMQDILKTTNILHAERKDIIGRTAIIAAAGPSLQDEIANLKEIKAGRQAYIFAVGSAVNALLSHGIYPDAVFSYDPSEKNQMVLQKVKDEKINRIPLIFGSGIGVESIADYPGLKMHMINASDFIVSYFLRYQGYPVETIATGPTITVAALDTVLRLGFGTVILVGQNLGAVDDRIYAGGISYIAEKVDSDEIFSETDIDVHGDPIKTNSAYLLMREGLEKAIAYTRSDAKIWNATKKGLAIKGTEFKELSELRKEMVPDSVTDAWLQTKYTKVYDKEHMEKSRKAMLQAQENVKAQVKRFKDIVEDIKKNTDLGLYSQLSGLYTKLNLTLKRLEENDYSNRMILPMMFKPYHDIIRRIEYFNTLTDKKEQSEAIYKEFHEFIRLYEESLAIVDEKMQELNEVLKDYVREESE